MECGFTIMYKLDNLHVIVNALPQLPYFQKTH
jgi:hypothetical protein